MKPNCLLLISFMVLLTVFTSCNGCGIQHLNENMGKVTRAIKSADSTTQKVSKGASKFVRHADQYMDTLYYSKDSSGQWHEK